MTGRPTRSKLVCAGPPRDGFALDFYSVSEHGMITEYAIRYYADTGFSDAVPGHSGAPLVDCWLVWERVFCATAGPIVTTTYPDRRLVGWSAIRVFVEPLYENLIDALTHAIASKRARAKEHRDKAAWHDNAADDYGRLLASMEVNDAD